MKTLTTLTAIAALIAGLSLASAQNSATTSSQASPSDLNKSNMPKTSGSQSPSTTGQASGTMNKVTGKSKFCITMSPGGSMDCKYASMDACQKAAKSGKGTCSANPNSSTTGAK